MESLECSRFVLLDECPANAESWFLARCFDALLARGVRGVVSFADPVPRTDASGAVVAVGHVGTIYLAYAGADMSGAPDEAVHAAATRRRASVGGGSAFIEKDHSG
ncbi:hypothetical protein QQY24_33040 [Streptomyces sp. TG1A-8]|uniref:Mom family adenine methylcarbamoylation protein n=1 Tax=Streptomyces sp. TG1A-8 TaxID=3051385 RepID=UPI00265BD056|nr:hypothetical protein [Streptomyces sp. TG1A-8]MDO0929927.1 hypothetical protein [Streptomyces sp. TG1A-8]